MSESTASLRRARYSNILNTVFGAALGVVGTIDFPAAGGGREDVLQTVANVGLATFHLVFAALSALWIIARIEVISEQVLAGHRVRGKYYLVLAIGILLTSAAQIGLSIALRDYFTIQTAGLQIASVLLSWSILLLFVAFWAKRLASNGEGNG